jgi:BirA family biotin operon repressor/biotin-[acetyl-CoA-carboxylase] ligase
MMWIEDLRQACKDRLIGNELFFFSEIDSTNREAHDRARGGAREGTVILADSQSRGKGRRGRSWESPSGANLYLSIILRPPICPSHAPQITLLAGVAAARALSGVSGLECLIKWPNDIFLRGKKLAGILAEMEGEGSKVRFVILGIGVNVNWRREDFPADLGVMATSLHAESGKEISRAAAAAELFRELEKEYTAFLREGFSARLKDEWNRLSWINGKQVTLSSPEGTLSGRALGLDTDGALLLLDGEGKTRRFIAGDVSLQRINKDEWDTDEHRKVPKVRNA